nr:MAG TPA: hypothetical protein [Caudoviricetes sp.]
MRLARHQRPKGARETSRPCLWVCPCDHRLQ